MADTDSHGSAAPSRDSSRSEASGWSAESRRPAAKFDPVLEGIIEAACRLAGCRCGLLLVQTGGLVPKVVTSGFRSGPSVNYAPLAAQLNDVVGDATGPIRLDEASRYPAAHRILRSQLPRARGLLVTPVRKAGDLRGYLCVVSEEDEPAFTSHDQNAVAALVNAAYSAVENSEIHDSERRRRGWPDIAAEIAQLLLGEIDLDRAMRLVTRRLRELAGADCTAIGLTDPAEPNGPLQGIIEWSHMCALHVRLPRRGLVQQALQRSRPVIVDEIVLDPGADLLLDWAGEVGSIGTAMFIPLLAHERVVGVLFSGWLQDAPLAECAKAENSLVSIFAEQIGPVLQRVEQQRIGVENRLLEDRERLAGKLCDVAMERMISISTQLHSIEGRSTEGELRQRLTHEVGELDDSIQQLRATIFGVDDQRPAPRPADDDLSQSSVSDALLHEIDSSLAFLGFVPRLVVYGSVDDVPSTLGAELVCAVREGLTSAAAHSPGHVEVLVHASDTRVALTVTDDAAPREPDHPTCPSELRARADRLGGTCTRRADRGHTVVEWTVPGTVGSAVE
ncbi:GAF domain-containing protein [Actinopolymorpha sp. NPDC004070]|uniref:GAF domain-containing sensor histidine kinase n=1 Tax=Actinopolymorpha sp. NPDC004070 TaxID=3154548 RepID=UPI0033A4D888